VAAARFLSRMGVNGEITVDCTRRQEPDETDLNESDIDRMMKRSTVTASTFQVWPLKRVLAQVRCGSKEWGWEEEWADLDRRHTETGYLTTLEQDIRENGITDPVLIGADGRLWDGHHRLRIAVRLGIGYVPVEVIPPGPEELPACSPVADVRNVTT